MISDYVNLLSHNYRVYGLVVKSEILFSKLIMINNREYCDVDVTISYGGIPNSVKEEIQNGKLSEFKKNEVWFSIDKVAYYYIANGNVILIEPYPNSNLEHIKMYILGSAFGILLIQRNMVAIHGGTIEIDGQGVIFTGESGSGKSTLTAVLRQKGYHFLSDDVSVVGKSSKGIQVVYPSYPEQKLCKDAILKLGYSVGKFTKIENDKDKYAIPVYNQFMKNPVPLGAVFQISVGSVNEPKLYEISGSKKLKIIFENIYRVEFTRYIGIEQSYFKNCSDIACSVPVYKIIRPKNSFVIDRQIQLIIETLKGIKSKFV